MRFLITGASGQLGQEILLKLQSNRVNVIGLSSHDIEFLKPDTVADIVASYKADWVINCAAYTDVDKAEEESEKAALINRDSARSVAEGVKSYGGRMAHISTDFVFNGKQGSPYDESDATSPLGKYGQSKYEGEKAVLEQLPDALILRTAWVYGIHGHNFVKVILRLASEKETLTVVDDQIGTPAWTADIADSLLSLINLEASGIYHFTNEGVASWYDFSIAIVAEAEKLGFPSKVKQIIAISTKDYPTPAVRPTYSVLSKIKIRQVLSKPIPYWRDSLCAMLKELKQNVL
ncbi:dTDP-4-dehydrorhamnose reductase [hydrothermal vent metagenome]|uniref:dTDP-4-dehydrorhamnose reductase n=1 Tax=hydrothermal vent metagenome TaxID=652676 RepID=A0A3B0XBY3_9ZZZZ